MLSVDNQNKYEDGFIYLSNDTNVNYISNNITKVLINSNLIDEIVIIDKSYSLIKKLRILKNHAKNRKFQY